MRRLVRLGRTRCSGLWLSLAAALLIAPLASAKADVAPDYAARAKTTIAALIKGRDFAPEDGCGDREACSALLAKLRAGDFAVIAPVERSQRPDLPSYLSARKRCPGLDPLRITVAHRVYAATRGFASYRVDLTGKGTRKEEILVFRAEHYVLEDRNPASGGGGGGPTLMPGTFVAVALRGCRLLSTARAEDGDWLAKHNAIGDSDHASELLHVGESYYVLNLAPIAGPEQPKASWWYTLELWDLGPHLDADRRHQRRVYSFGYKPGAAPADVRSVSGRAAPG
ncbi:MAG TPA: hypothetical protein VE397_16655 [Stellaceae bacterium]|nr:hypothetical protein [Stellaceae bacterium]